MNILLLFQFLFCGTWLSEEGWGQDKGVFGQETGCAAVHKVVNNASLLQELTQLVLWSIFEQVHQSSVYTIKVSQSKWLGQTVIKVPLIV